MTISTGSSLQNRSSRLTSVQAFSLQSGLGICLLSGVAAALVDLYLRAPLHLPGWRGLITMGLLVTARQLSGRAWGATAAAFAAALTSLALAGPPRFTTLAFLVPGLVIDGFCLLAARRKMNIFVAGLAGGLGNVAKLAITFFGVATFAQGGGAASHMLMPWLSHFGFGLCGGLLAMLLASPLGANSVDPRRGSTE
jgi:hypothetical protein